MRVVLDLNAAHSHVTVDLSRAKVSHTHTHTHTIILRLFWILSGTTRVSWYQKGETKVTRYQNILGSSDRRRSMRMGSDQLAKCE